MAILFFMLSGEIMCKGTMTEKLINWAGALIGHIRGGLAVAAGVAAGFFLLFPVPRQRLVLQLVPL